MGELAGNFWDSPEGTIEKDKQPITKPEGVEKIPIDGVDGVSCDGINQRDKLPIFKVSRDEFYQNMSNGRQRLRFKSDSDVSKYMRVGGKRSFWIQDETDGYIRKVR